MIKGLITSLPLFPLLLFAKDPELRMESQSHFQMRPIPKETKIRMDHVRKRVYGYRIPALLTTAKNTVILFAERRVGMHDHAQNDIVCKRSEDGGKTWGEEITIADNGADSLNNPMPVQLDDGRLMIMYVTRPYGYHQRATKWIKLMTTGYGLPTSSKCFIRYSDDDGKSWGEAIDITRQLRPESCLSTSSVGGFIQIKKGPHKGRVISSLYETTPDGKGDRTFAILTGYSDDRGKTWKRSKYLKKEDGSIYGNETQLAETADGKLILHSRNDRGVKFRLSATSADGGVTWSMLKEDPFMPSVACAGSIVAGPVLKDGGWNLYASFPSDRGRIDGVIKVSRDNGKSWQVFKNIPGSFAYSVLCISPDKKKLFCLYENKVKKNMQLIAVPLD